MKNSKPGIEQLGPIANENLHQRVYSEMRRAIMAGKFQPGETLTLRSLAAALGTSIMPARDAVLRLVAEHALETWGRSFRVPVLDLRQLKDIEKFRTLLEGEAAALAAERVSPAEINEIVKIMADAEKGRRTGELHRLLTANQAFHFAIYKASQNSLLISMIEMLWLQIGPHLSRVADANKGSDLSAIDLSAHDRLVEALRNHDPESARAAIASDLYDSTDMYRPYLADPENAGVAELATIRVS